jgi:hypothetical protein
MDPDAQAEIAALKIILANVVARLAITLERGGDGQVREVLAGMNDECKLAAEHATLSGGLAERGRMVNAGTSCGGPDIPRAMERIPWHRSITRA